MSEADRTNRMSGVAGAHRDPGVRPIRKRGYHRALKRGESWALIRRSFKSLYDDCAADMFRVIIKPNPLLKMFGLSEWVSVPIIYSKDSKVE